jgi:hypothetical protein
VRNATLRRSLAARRPLEVRRRAYRTIAYAEAGEAAAGSLCVVRKRGSGEMFFLNNGECVGNVRCTSWLCRPGEIGVVGRFAGVLGGAAGAARCGVEGAC